MARSLWYFVEGIYLQEIQQTSCHDCTSPVRMLDDSMNKNIKILVHFSHDMMTLQEWSANVANHLKYFWDGKQYLLTTFV